MLGRGFDDKKTGKADCSFPSSGFYERMLIWERHLMATPNKALGPGGRQHLFPQLPLLA